MLHCVLLIMSSLAARVWLPQKEWPTHPKGNYTLNSGFTKGLTAFARVFDRTNHTLT
jgi:hypothetical protein